MVPGPDHNSPSASTVQYLRRASKNILYTVVNSWVYEDGVTASSMDGWVTILMGADAAGLVVLAGLEVLLVKRWNKRRSQAPAQKH